MVVASIGRVTECETCGGPVQQPLGKGRPRKHCLECSPHRWPEKPKRRVPARVAGRPFTVPHFAAWAGRLRVAGGDQRFALEPFQARFAEDVFAGLPECWLVVPEGNGKTTLVALLALYHCEFRPEAWVTVAAASRDQAGLIYRQAAGFVQRNTALGAAFRCHPGYRRIHYAAGRSSIQIFAAEASTGDGIIPTLALIDEPHRHRSLDLYRTWAGKLDKEPGAQLVAISTAGEPGGEFELLREEFRRTATTMEREGCFVRALGAGSVLHEYAIPEDGSPEDLELVKAANPFSGITVESLAQKRARPSWRLAHWRRFTCNLPTRSDSAAIQEAEWFAAGTDEPIPEGESVWAGLDLGWNWDTTALVPLWVRDPEWRQFGPARILEHPGDGAQLDAHLVERAILELHERNPLLGVVMDPHQGQQLAQWIEEEVGVEVVQRGQTRPFQVLDYARFMEALRYGWLHHSNDPGLTQHVLNAIARMLPGGEMVFDRPAEARKVSASQRRLRVVDALDAAAMVHTTACAVAEPAGVVYA